MTGTEPHLSHLIAAEEDRQEEAWQAGNNGWPCELCISGRCGDMACDFGRHCQAAFCTPPLRDAARAGAVEHLSDKRDWTKELLDNDDYDLRLDAVRYIIALREHVERLTDFLKHKQWAVGTRAVERYTAGEISDLVAIGIVGQSVILLDEARREALPR